MAQMTRVPTLCYFFFFSLLLSGTQASSLSEPEVLDDLEFDAFQTPNIYARSVARRDPTHQHPQFRRADLIDTAYAGLYTVASTTSGIVRRDATKCLSDGSCADGSCCSKKGTCGYGPEFCGNGNCTSGCTATAMCGKYSKGGKLKCGMNLCCSATGWCGTTDIYCTNGDPEHNSLPCQKGFGSCEVKKGRKCGVGSGTTNGRTIGYYQGSNTRDRLCNLIYPADIDTKGYTHLYYAFASINPESFSVVPADSGDPELYTQFTALKSKGIKTWIAVGGFDFSDADKPTHGTWSKLCASTSNRAAFIQSLKDFMTKYGFQGVDLDWEYPVDEDRGGHEEDTANLVLLVKEMRAVFGNAFGISLTLAPDYWYLRYFDAKTMESSVDFFGFMAYDLHGFWDQDVKTLGSIVRGQADIRDIGNNTVPLTFAELDFSKINFGVALYGRGYTLKDKKCTDLECKFKGPSKPGVCTNGDGVLSLVEIEQLIKEKNLKPKYLPEAMMKQITWDDQWIGYDDAETIKNKKAWADDQCFGGTMAWSVDFNSGGGSGLDRVNTTDGKCGRANGNTVCGDWPQVAAFAAAAELTVEGAANLATVSLEVKQPMARAESSTKVPRVDHGHREIVVVLRVIVEGRKPIAV
ncbi:hypothetical protein GRF29_77g1643686 [Pseudopithomyces chartarum]|uniref:chitinase n=1 Tax=Pseudopithomyces chartarum TaxID=1892770 RepID=A0AAN6LX08_9PLEO|nr:hypothetical protein GRF29_77g1643686 [Pseudopithomyces chartarum]